MLSNNAAGVCPTESVLELQLNIGTNITNVKMWLLIVGINITKSEICIRIEWKHALGFLTGVKSGFVEGGVKSNYIRTIDSVNILIHWMQYL